MPKKLFSPAFNQTSRDTCPSFSHFSLLGSTSRSKNVRAAS